ncbi:hypothetical protein FQA39_LY07888 [Lamprigera yunnana]|nr:hypothetical protein FQA39_LY07888 [Lamprigera yunnana]
MVDNETTIPSLNISLSDLRLLKKYLKDNINDEIENEVRCEVCKWAIQEVVLKYSQNYHGYISMIVCLFGIIANLLTIVVLTRKDLASAPVNRILTGIAVADMLLMVEYISFAYYYYIELPGKLNFPYWGAAFILFHANFTQVLHTISISLTLTLAIWRFIAIGFSRPSYGDDAVSYVQLKYDGKICIVKGKICPEHKVHAKLYAVSVVVDEEEEVVISVQCHDCVASEGGCKHSIAFLILKYMTAKELSNGAPSLLSNSSVLDKFLDMGRKRKLDNCELLKYQSAYICDTIQSLSMHQLVLKYKEKCCKIFLEKLVLSTETITQIEVETREQHHNNLWFELRYGRITASRGYEFSRCKKNDGTLIALIMGRSIPDTAAMKRGRILENEVRKTVSINVYFRISDSSSCFFSSINSLQSEVEFPCDDCIDGDDSS